MPNDILTADAPEEAGALLDLSLVASRIPPRATKAMNAPVFFMVSAYTVRKGYMRYHNSKVFYARIDVYILNEEMGISS